MTKDKMNGKHHPNPNMENARGVDMEGEFAHKMQTVQLASTVFHALVQNTHNIDTPPAQLADAAFDLAEAFDQRVQRYLRPPKSSLLVAPTGPTDPENAGGL